jgi:PPP family 3-phenylpropionic acid transporter
VVCEIGIFLLMPKILGHASIRGVLLASFALAAARWLLIGLAPDNLALLIVAQTLHAATFGTFHAAGMQMAYRFFTGHHQHRGQAVYSTVGFGLGGAIGAYYSGHAWETLGAQTTYAIAAGCALGAWIVTWRGLNSATR